MDRSAAAPTATAAPRTAPSESANERLKRGWSERLWGSMIVAVAVHFGAFQLWPEMTAAEMSTPSEAFDAVTLPEVELPPEPEAITRPAAPVTAASEVSADVTIAPQDWEAPTAAPPPPTATADGGALDAGRGFTPFTVAPTIRNRTEVARALDRAYPQILKGAGIGGTVRVVFEIDEAGRVLGSEIAETSGHPRLDAAALEVAGVMRFTPALNRENPVAVRVTFPIVFEVR